MYFFFQIYNDTNYIKTDHLQMQIYLYRYIVKKNIALYYMISFSHKVYQFLFRFKHPEQI